jgi:PAS domain S-box-containing protein
MKKVAENSAVSKDVMLQRIIDILPIRIFWKDRDLKFLGCNLLFARDAGKAKPEDLIGKDDSEMGWKEQAKRYQEDDRMVMKSGKPKLDFEEPQTTLQGNTIWLKTSKVPLTDAKGNIIGILGMYEDITAQKTVEAEKNKIAEFNESIIRSTSDWIWEVDVRGKYTYCSEKIKQILGFNAQEIIGKSPFDLMPKDEVQRISGIFEQAIATKNNIVDLENWNLHKDGHRVCLLTNGIPVLDKAGNLKGYIGVDKDITARKTWEEELRKSRDLLQSKIEELETFNRIAVDRELKMVELKEKIERLEQNHEGVTIK